MRPLTKRDAFALTQYRLNPAGGGKIAVVIGGNGDLSPSGFTPRGSEAVPANNFLREVNAHSDSFVTVQHDLPVLHYSCYGTAAK